jgi:hypothetical protein
MTGARRYLLGLVLAGLLLGAAITRALEGTPGLVLPVGALAVVRSTNTSGATLYTVPAGKRLWLTAVSVSATGSTTVGTARLRALVENDTTETVLEIQVPISAASPATQAASNATLSGLSIPVLAGGQISTAATGLTGATTSYGFAGWEEPLTK